MDADADSETDGGKTGADASNWFPRLDDGVMKVVISLLTLVVMVVVV